jgi:hypothetical protein
MQRDLVGMMASENSQRSVGQPGGGQPNQACFEEMSLDNVKALGPQPSGQTKLRSQIL